MRDAAWAVAAHSCQQLGHQPHATCWLPSLCHWSRCCAEPARATQRCGRAADTGCCPGTANLTGFGGARSLPCLSSGSSPHSCTSALMGFLHPWGSGHRFCSSLCCAGAWGGGLGVATLGSRPRRTPASGTQSPLLKMRGGKPVESREPRCFIFITVSKMDSLRAS